MKGSRSEGDIREAGSDKVAPPWTPVIGAVVVVVQTMPVGVTAINEEKSKRKYGRR